MTISTQKLGAQGEAWASHFAETHFGWRLLERNVHFRSGEIDLIFLDAGTLVFVEVKTRRNGGYGWAVESLSEQKIAHLKKACLEWLRTKGVGRGFRMECFAIQIKGTQWTLDRFPIE